MDSHQIAPVLLNIFKRPKETAELLERIRLVKPRKIFVSADGPRKEIPEEADLCREVRDLVKKNIDWDAEVYWDLPENNIGLRNRIPSAISWAFEKVDRLIILEDDCIPSSSFFGFSSELLDTYAEEQKVGAISGNNFLLKSFLSADPSSYYFSRYVHIWGWATWKRSWNLYDGEMLEWPRLRETDWLQEMFPNKFESAYWKGILDGVYNRGINTWDYQWLFSLWLNDKLSITPSKNLVSNIGTGPGATNTCKKVDHHHFLRAFEVDFPLVHPTTLDRNQRADNFVQKTHFGRAKDPSIKGRLKRLWMKFLKKVFKEFR